MRVIATCGLLAIVHAAAAQDSRPAATAELRAAVEAYLAEREDTAAARLLDTLVKRPDATAENVRSALAASEDPIVGETTLPVPHKNQVLSATLQTPEGHTRNGPRIPVVIDIAQGDIASWLELKHVIVVFVKGYKPQQFSDEGRDAFLKILRTAAHRAHGDLDRLWYCGFSWAGHAGYDGALHRPGTVRGIIPMAGGPRRQWFRLLSQLALVKTLAFCGMKDDPELIWNLREVEHLAPKLKLDFKLKLDPAQAHDMPLIGTEVIEPTVLETAALEPPQPLSGTLLADGALVESLLLRVDAVDETRVAVPQAVPVPGDISPDAKRRATIAAMASKVAKMTWKIEDKKAETVVTLTRDGVSAATLFVREPPFRPGQKLTVKVDGKTVFSEILVADPKTMAADARRTGLRLRPALRAIEIK